MKEEEENVMMLKKCKLQTPEETGTASSLTLCQSPDTPDYHYRKLISFIRPISIRIIEDVSTLEEKLLKDWNVGMCQEAFESVGTVSCVRPIVYK